MLDRDFRPGFALAFGNFLHAVYARLALELGVPIVPVATIGSHYSYTMLPGGTAIARIARMKRWARTERFPLVLGVVVAFVVDGVALAGVLPWWTMGAAAVLALVPNPVRVTSEVLPPIDVSAATSHIADPAERVEAAHALVLGELRRAVATLEHSP